MNTTQKSEGGSPNPQAHLQVLDVDRGEGGSAASTTPPPRRSSWPWTIGAVVLSCLALLTPWQEVWQEDLSTTVPMPFFEESESDDPAWKTWTELRKRDQVLHTWLASRNARVLISEPGRLFDTEECHPTENMLALGEPMISLGILGTPFAVFLSEPIAIYNCILMLSMLLAPLAMYFLIKEWTGIPAAGIVAALLYGFHPDKIWDINHIFVDDTTWVVFALLFAQRFFARGAWWDALLFALFCGMQISGSFYPFVGSVLVALPMMGWLFTRYGVRKISLVWTLAALALIGLEGYLVFGPYLEMREASVLVERSFVAFAQWKNFLPGGERFPGWIALGLIGFGLASLRRDQLARMPHLWLIGGAVLVTLVAVSSGGVNEAPAMFQLLAKVVPGLVEVRRPNEILAGFHLCVSILAGLGCGALLRRIPPPKVEWVAGALIACVFVAMLKPAWLGLEPRIVYVPYEIRPAQKTLDFFAELERAGNWGPIAEVPYGRFKVEMDRVFLTEFHRRRTSSCVNNHPRELKGVRALLDTLPAEGAISGLRAIDYTTILVHHRPDTPKARAMTQSIAEAARLPGSSIQMIQTNEKMTAYQIRE